MERNDAMSAEYETVKSSDYERKVFKADSEKKKHPALAVLFLLLTLIFVTLAFLIPPAFVVIIGYAISLLSLLLSPRKIYLIRFFSLSSLASLM